MPIGQRNNMYRKNKKWKIVAFSLLDLMELESELKRRLEPGDDIVDVKINIATGSIWAIVAFIAELEKDK